MKKKKTRAQGKNERNPEQKIKLERRYGSGGRTHRDVRTGGYDREGMGFGMVEGGNAEVGSQA